MAATVTPARQERPTNTDCLAAGAINGGRGLYFLDGRMLGPGVSDPAEEQWEFIDAHAKPDSYLGRLQRLRTALLAIVDGAPERDPDEGDWDSAEDAFGAGMSAQHYVDAEIARAALRETEGADA